MTDDHYIVGDARAVLRRLPSNSVQAIITSPPYYRKRGYDSTQVVEWGGREDCAHEWAWRRELISPGGPPGRSAKVHATRSGRQRVEVEFAICMRCGAWKGALGTEPSVDSYVEHLLVLIDELGRVLRPDGVMFFNIGDSYDVPKWSKSLAGVPYMLMLRLIGRGWLIRNIITWYKPNAMPTSAKDRLANATEAIIVAALSKRYKWNPQPHLTSDLWEIALQPWSKHPAIFPPELPRRCIELASDPGDAVLDPFAGSGTTAAVATYMQRIAVSIDTSTEYKTTIYPQRKQFVHSWLQKHPRP